MSRGARNPRGSVWQRWDPHVHTPGTAFNDQYKGTDPWDSFLSAVETSSPTISAIGVTDYFSIDNYLRVVTAKESGRIPKVALVFPNVEMRLGYATSRSNALNIHLLFSPEDSDHPTKIRRFLSELTFSFLGVEYRCEESELIKLGRAHDASINDDASALRNGANQFKVDFNDLRARWQKNDWVRNNCLVAVAGGETDGTSGLRDATGSWDATRKGIEAFAQIVFSATPQQRDFWLGDGVESVASLNKTWGGVKPCLHGSDAHAADRVGRPAKERLCWIKGDLTFETLRQVCMEPRDRVWLGAEPGRGALAGQTIQSITLTSAPWVTPGAIPLNAGLIAVIGARGSGKTALADLIATGAYAFTGPLSEKSFIYRARELLGDGHVCLTWEQGDETQNELRHAELSDLLDSPRVQYLSQEFVNELCSSEGLGDQLVGEIKRVIFNAHALTDRMGTSSFDELLDLRSQVAREKRLRHELTLAQTSRELTEERLLKASLPALTKQRNEKAKFIEKDKRDRKALAGSGQEERTKKHEEISIAVDAKRQEVQRLKRRVMALTSIKEDVREFRENNVKNWLADLRLTRSDAGLQDEDWSNFNVAFEGDVDGLLDRRRLQAVADLLKNEGTAEGEPTSFTDAAVSVLPTGASLATQTLSLLELELSRLAKLIGIDSQNAKRYAELSAKITKEETALGRLDDQIKRAETAGARIDTLRARRSDAYGGVFAAVGELEDELKSLYAPLEARLASAVGQLAKLSFSVKRAVDTKSWATRGEALLDLRKAGPFKGQGALEKTARAVLQRAWESGASEDVAEAMTAFLAANEKGIREHKPENLSASDWARDVAQWLHSTEHIKVSYSLQYDQLDIESLSQGTRGIVLLLLYLALDLEDDRPLIIDQPEENLDPKSIFDELVARFRDTKTRRQILIVTHNANLVVNTDADQVIVAKCGPHLKGELPTITYFSGGLENAEIQAEVCDILEGGADAFRERAKRLRLTI